MSVGAWSLIILDSRAAAAGPTTLTFAGLASAEAFGTSAVRDITPPGNIQVINVSATKVSRVAGKDTTQFTITANEPFVQFQIRRVSSPTDPINAGTQVVNLLLI